MAESDGTISDESDKSDIYNSDVSEIESDEIETISEILSFAYHSDSDEHVYLDEQDWIDLAMDTHTSIYHGFSSQDDLILIQTDSFTTDNDTSDTSSDTDTTTSDTTSDEEDLGIPVTEPIEPIQQQITFIPQEKKKRKPKYNIPIHIIESLSLTTDKQKKEFDVMVKIMSDTIKSQVSHLHLH
jgi:hypothetical protein